MKSIFNYQPKGYLVIGTLSEFKTDNEINEVKYSLFELFRRNLSNPEIIAFDELFERAKSIVTIANEGDGLETSYYKGSSMNDDDLPF